MSTRRGHLSLLLTFLFLLCPSARGDGLQAAGAPPRVDRYGDALPAGAAGRLGTMRLRH